MTNRFSRKESIYLRIDDWNLFDQRLDKKSYIDYHGKKYTKYMSACIMSCHLSFTEDVLSEFNRIKI